MEISSKVTRSLCLFLEGKGHVIGDCLETAGISVEVALDSERWISAEKVEKLLEVASFKFTEAQPKKIAKQAHVLKGWGLLDQVLRIIKSSSEIFENPQNFLSYFVNLEKVDRDLKINWVEKKEELSIFSVDFFTDEYPLITAYLSGALEAVSTFSGGPPAYVVWSNGRVSIDWSQDQESIFEAQEPTNLKPEFYKEAVEIIKRQQDEILGLKSKLKLINSHGELPVREILNQLNQLKDYFLRSRQLVSLLQVESGSKKWFKDALKRLKWSDIEKLHEDKILELGSLLKGESLKKDLNDEEEQSEFKLESE